jgi:hypothetical protein
VTNQCELYSDMLGVFHKSILINFLQENFGNYISISDCFLYEFVITSPSKKGCNLKILSNCKNQLVHIKTNLSSKNLFLESYKEFYLFIKNYFEI